MESFHADDNILSYNDVVLRRSDLSILRGPLYINDRIIEFYFSYLSSSYSTDDILLVPPSISFWIMHCLDVESLVDVVKPLDLPKKKVVIFTVNDNEDFTIAEGGIHWSLLVYEKCTDVFVHHDSIGGSNTRHARKLFKAVQGFVREPDSNCDAGFLDGPTPQQLNCYDCGLFTMAIAKAICLWYTSGLDKGNRWFSAVKGHVTCSSASNLRKEVLVLIEDLMKEKISTKGQRSRAGDFIS